MIRLYSGASCLQSHRVRLALAHKGVEAEWVVVDPAAPPRPLLELTPYGEVPTLLDRDVCLYEPWIIVEYLDERYPHPPLLMADPVSRAKARLVAYRIERDWYSLYAQLTAARVRHRGVGKARQALYESLTAGAELFEDHRCLLSDEFTIMDLAVLPLLWRLPAAGVELPPQAAAMVEYAETQFHGAPFQASLTSEEQALRSAKSGGNR